MTQGQTIEHAHSNRNVGYFQRDVHSVRTLKWENNHPALRHINYKITVFLAANHCIKFDTNPLINRVFDTNLGKPIFLLCHYNKQANITAF